MNKLIKVLCLVAVCVVATSCVEAKFNLAPDSRLPAWFSGAVSQRTDVTVTLAYSTPTPGFSNAVLEMRDSTGAISTVKGTACWHPAMAAKKNRHGGFDSDVYPRYRYVLADGIIEVIEHRRLEPVFRVSDDPLLRKGAFEASSCDKG